MLWAQVSIRRVQFWLCFGVVAAYCFSVEPLQYKNWYLAASLAVGFAFVIRITPKKASLFTARGLGRSRALVLLYFAYALLSSTWGNADEVLLNVAIDSIFLFSFSLFYIFVCSYSDESIVRLFSYVAYPALAATVILALLAPDASRLGRRAYELLPICIPFMWIYATKKRTAILPLCIALAVVLVSRSRSAIGVTFVELAVCVFLLREHRQHTARVVSRLAVVLALVGLVVVLSSRMTGLVSRSYARIAGRDVVVSGVEYKYFQDIRRARLERESSRMLWHSQPFGMGYGDFPSHHRRVYGYPMAVHNMYYAWLIEGGVFLFAIAAAIIWGAARALGSPRAPPESILVRRALLIALLGQLVVGWFHPVHRLPMLWIVLGMSYAIVNRGTTRSRESEQVNNSEYRKIGGE